MSDSILLSIHFDDVDPTCVYSLGNDKYIYIMTFNDKPTVYLRQNSLMFDYISPGQFVDECMSHQQFEVLKKFIPVLQLEAFGFMYANMFWESLTPGVSKLNCLKLYCIINNVDYSIVDEEHMSLANALDLSLFQTFELYQSKYLKVEPLSCPDSLF